MVVFRINYDTLTEQISTYESETVKAYFMPRDEAFRHLVKHGWAYVSSEDVDAIKTDLRRAVSNSHVGYDGRIGRSCPYCEFVALNARDYFQHLADVETKHVLTGAARNDVPYRGMAAMAEARLQNRYAIEERRRQNAAKENA